MVNLRPVDRMLGSSERDLLGAFLQAQRDAVAASVDGMTTEELSASLVPSLTTLGGIVAHLTVTEAWWFRVQFDGQDVDVPWTRGAQGAEWDVAAGTTGSQLVAAYEVAGRASDEVIARFGLDDLGRGPVGRRGAAPSLRWVLLHMIEETARHAGHADILREQCWRGRG